MDLAQNGWKINPMKSMMYLIIIIINTDFFICIMTVRTFRIIYIVHKNDKEIKTDQAIRKGEKWKLCAEEGNGICLLRV